MTQDKEYKERRGQHGWQRNTEWILLSMTGATYTSVQGAQIDTKVQVGGGMDATYVGYDTRQGIQGEERTTRVVT